MAHLTWLFIWTYAVYTHICVYPHDRIQYAIFSIRFHADVRKTRNAYSHMKKTHARLCWAPMYMWSDELRSRFRSMLFDLASILKFALLCFYSPWCSNVCGLLFYLCPYQLPKLFQQGLTTCLSDIGFSLTNWHLTSTYRNSSHVPSSNNRCYKPCVSHLCLLRRLA